MQPEGAALVTGAGRGIGRAVALELAARGFDVLAGMRDPERGAELAAEASARGGRLRPVAQDVTDAEAFEPPPDLRVLVNNAGVDGPHLPVEAHPLDDWRRLFETNLFGLLAVTRRAIPALRAAGGGVICNVTSCSLLVPMPFFAAYRASKAAVSALGESLRTELAPSGIRVLEVQPGAIETDMLRASEGPLAAHALPRYRDMAATVHRSRADASGSTPPADAARAIADAILDDDAPLRVACDAMGAGLLEGWRSQSDEDWMRPMTALFGGAPGPAQKPR